MTIKETHDFINFVLNKETSGYVSHKDIDSALDRAQMSKFVELYGQPKGYQPGRPIPPIAYGMTQKVNDDLRPFKKRQQFTSSSSGIILLSDLSGEYLHLLAAYITGTQNNVPVASYSGSLQQGAVEITEGTENKNYQRPVKIVNEDQLAEKLVSQISGPSATSPVGILGDGGNKIQLFPEIAHSGYIMYLVRPSKPLFSHVVDGRKIVHNASALATSFTATNALTLPDGTSVAAGATYSLAGSINLEWAEDCMNDIIIRTLSYLGVHIEDTNVFQYTELKTKEGL